MVHDGASFLAEPWILIPVIVAECWLMVSPLRMFSLKFKNLGWKGNEARWMLVISALRTSGLLWLIVFYIIASALPFSRRDSADLA